jgi:two-component system nitrogen regulation sensor histidine kinase NtrY
LLKNNKKKLATILDDSAPQNIFLNDETVVQQGAGIDKKLFARHTVISHRNRRLLNILRRRFITDKFKRSWSARFTLFLILAAVVSGILTYLAFTEAPPFGHDPNSVIWLLNIDMIILLLMVTLIARRGVALWSGHKRGAAGSRMHVRLVLMFGLLAALPAVIMTVFTAVFLHFAVQSWFGERVSTSVRASHAVAEAYLGEHHQVIRADILAMANDLDRQAYIIQANPEGFDRFMQTQSMLRNLTEAIVFNAHGQIVAHSGIIVSFNMHELPDFAISQANKGEVALLTSSNDDRVRALVRLNNFTDTYLYVGRMVDPIVLSHVNKTKKAVADYIALDTQRSKLQIQITLIFVMVALMVLLAAIWAGLNYARQLAIPISNLILAAERVRAGDLSAQVPALNTRDDFDVLGNSFNRMTAQLRDQRNELVNANRLLDHRRRFTEMILAGVSSGVVGLNEEGIVTLINSSAAELFDKETNQIVGIKIIDLLPDLKDTLELAHLKPSRITQIELPYIGKNNTRKTLLVRITIELIGEIDNGAVLTFDDITELQSAQRKAAWADVARRIAHEIKNPLTPIQLSAERLKRKYSKQITDDLETFERCTETIIHHVGDIGRMVNEFSAFARMPLPVFKNENLSKLINDIIVMRREAHQNIQFTQIENGQSIHADIDGQQMRQVITNIIQNAVDSLEPHNEKEHVIQTMIGTHVNDDGDKSVIIAISDNGPGFPKDVSYEQLTEPYVTHREKGTGLGLAICKKIMEDHKGQLILGNADMLSQFEGWAELPGATVVLTLPSEKQSHGTTIEAA